MITKTVPIAEIKPFEKNAKLHPGKQVKEIARSIQAFGFNQPIVVDKKGEIIVGHGRYLAAIELGLKEVPVLVLGNLTDHQIRAYRIADNRLNESDWKMELVIEELTELNTKGFDITLTGFSKEIFGISEDNFDAEKERGKIKKPVVQRGDVWLLGDHRLVCGDATDIDDVKKLMGGGKARMVFTDPPYGVAYKSVGSEKHTAIKNDDLVGEKLINFLKDTFDILDIVTADECCFYIWHGSQTQQEFRSALELSEASNWKIHQILIWLKNKFTMGRSDYQQVYEPCFYGWKHGKTHFTNKNIRNYDNVIKLDADSFAEMLDVWFVDRDNMANYEHPTQKPVRLAERALKKSSEPGDVVLDVFGGSGSTLIACEQLGRKCYTLELDQKYCDVIIKRWEQLTKGVAEKI